MNVVIIDSGMGGLEVAARLFERVKRRGVIAAVSFVNVRPQDGARYENQITRQAKVAMFEQTLRQIERTLALDAIVIACNSLSVLAHETSFYARNAHKISLIHTLGIDEFCATSGKDFVYLLGTEMTITSGVHRRLLLAGGVPPDRLVEQACGGLANSIQDDYTGHGTFSLVQRYVAEAVGKKQAQCAPGDLDAGTRVFLACSHYGFVEDRFHESFALAGIQEVQIFNANRHMAMAIEEQIVSYERSASWPAMNAPSIQLYSQHPVTDQECSNFVELITPLSKTTADALERIENIPERREFNTHPCSGSLPT